MSPTAGALDALVGLGPFFEVAGHPSEVALEPPWLPLQDVLDGSGALAVRVAAVRAALAASGGVEPSAIEERVAASVTQLGLVARLVSPALGMFVLSGVVLEFDPRRTYWQDVVGGTVPVSVALPTAGHTGASSAAVGLIDGSIAASAGSCGRSVTDLIDGPIAALVAAVRASFGVSEHVLWGNVASGVNGAAGMIARARPDLVDRTLASAGALLDHPRLRSEWSAAPAFMRRSCCLIYRIAPDHDVPERRALCGDCVLAA